MSFQVKNDPFFLKVWSEGCQHPRGAFFFLKNDPFFFKVWCEGCSIPRRGVFSLKSSVSCKEFIGNSGKPMNSLRKSQIIIKNL